MENAFKVKTKMKLTLTDQIIYSLISCYSDAHGTSHISRQKLAEKSGIKKLDTITRHTNALAKKGLIRKTHTRRDGKKLAQYYLINPKQDFMWISNDVFKYGANTAGFLIKLAELRGKDTNRILMSNNAIIKAMGISKTTFYRYIKELKSFGIISEIEDGLSVSTELFPIYQTGNQGIEAFKETLDKAAEIDSNFKYNRVYKEFYRHYNTGFKNLHMPLKDFPNSLESGVFFLPSKKEKVPDTRQTEYQF